MLNISHRCIEQLQTIRDKYLSHISEHIPIKNNWKGKTNDELWLAIVVQVVVVGNASPADKLDENEYKQKISYEKLKKINNDNTISAIIHEVLRSIGARYVGEDITKCKKTSALVHNLGTFKSYPNGPKDFFNHLEGITGNDYEAKRINYVIDRLKYVKNKGARDLLMELGLVRNAIALDVRVVNTLRRIGIDIPEGYENNANLYAQIEKEILEKICIPLKLSGVQLDRLLFHTYP